MRRWVTEFVGLDGNRYVGPIILDESKMGAEAILSVLLGPNGQLMRLSGELLTQHVLGEDTESLVRRVS